MICIHPRYNYLKYLISCYFLLFLTVARSQEAAFNRLTIEDGLSQNSVLSVVQDKRGFLWFGTRDGLNKYDAFRFSVYRNNPADNTSISDSYIMALHTDHNDVLWVGTRNGLNRYDAPNDRFTKISLKTTSSTDVQNKTINCIYEDRKGRLWVGTDYGIKILTSHGNQTAVHELPFLKQKRIVRCIYQDHQNVFWVGTATGIIKLKEERPGKFTLSETLTHQKSSGNSLSSDQITAILEDAQRQMWIGTQTGGLNRYNRHSGNFTYFTHTPEDKHSLISNSIRKLLLDNRGELWIGTQDGVSVLNPKTKQITNYENDPWDRFSLSQNSVHSLYKDRAGSIWVGTFFGGVNSYSFAGTPFTTYSNRSPANKLNNNVVSSIIEDGHANLWVGTEGGGVNYLDLKKGTSSYFVHHTNDPGSLGSDLVKIIYRDKSGDIWVGTHGGGLNLFDQRKHRFKRFLYENYGTVGTEITCLLEDSQHIFWVGTETSGVRLFKKNDTTILPLNNPAVYAVTRRKAIFSILEASDKKIWLGGAEGLYMIDKEDVSIPQQLAGSPPLHINDIFEDSSQHIWVATAHDGLLKYDQQGKILQHYTDNDGLFSNQVLGILQDEKHLLWISTANGLYRFDPQHGVFNHYTEADGLPGLIFNKNAYYKNKEGKMLFGGYNGFVSFFPKDININRTPPPLYITSLHLPRRAAGQLPEGGGQKFRPVDGKQVRLHEGQNSFTIQFAALNYVKAPKNRYQYFLEGYDNTWNQTNNPSAAYSNVPPGDYQFRVKGSNNDQVWSKEIRLPITILPPIWKTSWAYACYALAFAGVVFLLIRYFFLKALYRKNQEITQLKLNFFTNISHEIRTHLSLITGPAERLIYELKQNPQARLQLNTIKNNSESLLQLVNELMDFRRAETGHLRLFVCRQDVVPFLQSIYTSFHVASVTKNIQADFISTAEHIPLYFDKEQLEKVFYNLLSNAFKFTPHGSHVAISVEEQKEAVKISVINKGKGISEANRLKLFDNYFQENNDRQTGYGIGLALSKSIVDLHGGGLTVSSECKPGLDNCTSFAVTLLKGMEHFSKDQLQETPQYPAHKIDDEISAQQAAAHPYAVKNIYRPADRKQVVLLVEDNKAIRTFIKEAFEDGYTILESENGQEGWQAAISEIPDLIVSDVMMPEMDGIELGRKIKADERTSHIPLILLTAKNTIVHQIDGLEMGAAIYLTKPFSVQILSLHIFNLLKARENLWRQFSRQMRPAFSEEAAPDQEIATPLHPLDEAFIKRIIKIVEEKLDDPGFGVAMLSSMAGMSQPVLFKKIKAITGLSANEFVKTLRLKKAAALLADHKYTVYEVAYMVGYDSSKYFSREFKKYYHMTPTEYSMEKQVVS